MVDIYIKEEFYAYDAFHIVKAFLPNEEIKQHINRERNEIISIDVDKQTIIKIDDVNKECTKKENKSEVNKKIYKEMERYTNKSIAWGILTGIRPTKILMKKLEDGKSEEEIKEWFQQQYLVSEKKATLGMEIAKREKKSVGTVGL